MEEISRVRDSRRIRRQLDKTTQERLKEFEREERLKARLKARTKDKTKVRMVDKARVKEAFQTFASITLTGVASFVSIVGLATTMQYSGFALSALRNKYLNTFKHSEEYKTVIDEKTKEFDTLLETGVLTVEQHEQQIKELNSYTTMEKFAYEYGDASILHNLSIVDEKIEKAQTKEGKDAMLKANIACAVALPVSIMALNIGKNKKYDIVIDDRPIIM